MVPLITRKRRKRILGSPQLIRMDYNPGVPRRLFSQNYVDGGCEGEPPKNTTTDDTLGCYATNYLILVIGVLAAMAFVRARERLERAGASGVERGLAAAYAAFFALTGLGYGAAGVLHHRFALAPPGWWAAAYVVVLLGNAGLCGVGAAAHARRRAFRKVEVRRRGDGACQRRRLCGNQSFTARSC